MSGYLEVIFVEETDPTFAVAFDDAAEFWNKVITASPVRPITFDSGFNAQGDCQVDFTFSPGSSIDGLTVLSSVANIDGPGSILGQAGPCLFDDVIPRLGIMRFDSSDVQSLVDSGNWEGVIRHEMAHVIGIGTVWTRSGFLNSPCGAFSFFGCDPMYNRPEGIAGYEQLGGSGLVPVANTGGAGTQNGHWREATFENELMTGFLNSGVDNPVSIMTVKALTDIGYIVDLDVAEDYVIPTGEARISTAGFDLGGDVLPITPVDISEVLMRLENEKLETEQFEMNFMVIAVIAMVAALFAVMVAFVGIRRRSRQTVTESVVAKQAEPENMA